MNSGNSNSKRAGTCRIVRYREIDIKGGEALMDGLKVSRAARTFRAILERIPLGIISGTARFVFQPRRSPTDPAENPALH